VEFPVFPLRQIHLDFHTPPQIPDVGADWDADHFVKTLQEARVNSITVFALCHHGMCYYPSKVGTVHPSLKFDLLGEQIEALHRAGIRAPIYVTVVWNVDAAQRHPEWRQVDKNGKQVGPGPLEPGWPWLCVNTAYADELLAQTEELMAAYDCDGFFYDIVMYNGEGCLCSQCLPEMRAQGLDPADPNHRRIHNHQSARKFMDRASRLIRAKLPHAGIYYNSRWGLHFADEADYYSQVEIESLPTGGWGYGFYPLWSRYGRHFDLPMLGMTGRFHRTWADWGGLKHPDALKFECGGILATGGAVSIGDQLHPRGRLNEAVYEVIGEAFRDVEAVEEFCIGATAETEVGLLVLAPDADKANQASAGIVASSNENIEGAAKMLLELHQQFDVITPKMCPDFSRYKVLVLADRTVASQDDVSRLRAFVENGGKLLVTHEALLDHTTGNFALADLLGVDYQGPATSVPDYFIVTEPALHGPLIRPGFAYSVYDGPAARVAPQGGTKTLADAYETYFNRTGEHFISHGFTPPVKDKAAYPAVTESANGNVVYLHGPIFSAYQKYGNLSFRALVGGCLKRLLPDPLITTDAPATCEVSLMRQPDKNWRVVHLVNYHAQRRAPGHVEALETPVPLRDVALSLHVPDGDAAPARAFLARSGTDLPVTSENGVARVTIPRADAHEMVVFE
jgi:hypothetical protein